MTSNNIVRDVEIILQAAKDGKWRKVFHMYKEKKDLHTVGILSTGDTILHMAVSSGELYIVEDIVDLVCPRESNEQAADENGNQKNLVFGAKNKKGNTPLHLAASAPNGSLEMCKKVGGADRSIITTGNNDGETPLFLAALHGNKEAFIWLHCHIPQGSSSDYKRNDNDTILHCAIAGGHIDVGIAIVCLYEQYIKDMTMTLNKNGLSPLHLLAATPSAFESTDLPSRFFVVRLLYHFFIVKKKQQATMKVELERREWKLHENPLSIIALVEHVFRIISCGMTTCQIDELPQRLPCCIAPIWRLIGFLLMVLAWVLAVPLKILKIFISAANKFRNWFHGIRKMKEKHAWSLQILEILLQHASNEDKSLITSGTPSQPSSSSHETIEHKEEGSKIVDPSLMIAAKNGMIEMVEKILKFFPSGMNVLDDEGKNIVLLAAEKRQTKLYQFLYRRIGDNTAFRRKDKGDNTALHLAAKSRINLYGQTTTMVEEFKWFQFVKSSVPNELREGYNKEGKTAEEIFRDSYKEHMTRDRKWLNQTSQTCSVASTLVAGMAFSNIGGENIGKRNDDSSSFVALSLSLTSTISFLAILAFRSQSLNFWKYVPFMLHIAILTMFGSIVALWFSLMFPGQPIATNVSPAGPPVSPAGPPVSPAWPPVSPAWPPVSPARPLVSPAPAGHRTIAAYVILGSPIAILTIFSLPIFIGPTVMSMLNEVPPPNPNTTNAIQSQRPQKKENGVDKDQKPTSNPTFRANDLIQDTTGSPMTCSRSKRMKEALQVLISDMLEMEAQLKDA